MFKPYLAYIFFMIYCLLSMNTWAKDMETSRQFGDYTVFYSVFPSTFIQADIAKAYGFKRSTRLAFINIAVNRAGDIGGQPARIEGRAKNLLQQEQTLKFKTIREHNVVYYIAPLRTINEEIFHFSIDIQPESSEQSFTLTFSKKLYAD